MNEQNTDICPSCNIPYTEHLGLVPLCRQLQEAESMKKLLLRDSVEDNDAIREIAASFGLDVDGDSYFVPSPTDLVSQIAGIARGAQEANQHADEAVSLLAKKMEENQRLREALEKIRNWMWVDEYDVDIEEVHDIAHKALSPSAPADTHQPPSVSDKPASVEPVSDKGAWLEFVPSPENPVREGDQIFDASDPHRHWYFVNDSIGATSKLPRQGGFRRSHPATTNQEET